MWLNRVILKPGNLPPPASGLGAESGREASLDGVLDEGEANSWLSLMQTLL